MRSESQAANSIDFDSYFKSQVKAKKLIDRINVSQLIAAESNIGLDEVSQSFKARSSLHTSLLSRHEQLISHCAIN